MSEQLAKFWITTALCVTGAVFSLSRLFVFAKFLPWSMLFFVEEFFSCCIFLLIYLFAFLRIVKACSCSSFACPKTSKHDMFAGPYGSISSTVCRPHCKDVFDGDIISKWYVCQGATVFLLFWFFLWQQGQRKSPRNWRCDHGHCQLLRSPATCACTLLTQITTRRGMRAEYKQPHAAQSEVACTHAHNPTLTS